MGIEQWDVVIIVLGVIPYSMSQNFKQEYKESFPLRSVIKLMSRINIYNESAISNGCAVHTY